MSVLLAEPDHGDASAVQVSSTSQPMSMLSSAHMCINLSKFGIVESQGMIGPSGGTIGVAGCRVSFAVNEVSSETSITLQAFFDRSLCSDNSLCATPMLRCLPAMKFKIPPSIELPIWMSTTSRNVKMTIHRQEEDQARAEVIKKKSLAEARGIVQFETYHFTKFWSSIRKKDKEKIVCNLHLDLYYGIHGHFTLVVRADTEYTETQCHKDLQHHNLQSANVLLSPITMSITEKLKIALECETHQITPPKVELDMEGEFISNLRQYFTFEVMPPPEGEERLSLLYTAEYGGRRPKETRIPFVWPVIVPEAFGSGHSTTNVTYIKSEMISGVNVNATGDQTQSDGATMRSGGSKKDSGPDGGQREAMMIPQMQIADSEIDLR